MSSPSQSAVHPSQPAKMVTEESLRYENFDHLAKVLTSLDVVNLALMLLTSVNPIASALLAVFFPLFNVPCLKLTQKTGKPFFSYSIFLTAIPLYWAARLGGPECPSWVICCSALTGVLASTPIRVYQIVTPLVLTGSSVWGSYHAGKPGYEVLGIAFVLLIFWAIISQIHRFLMNQLERITASNQALAHFAGAAAHDLRSPLRKIYAWSNLAREASQKGNKEELEQHINRIRLSARQTDALVTSFFEYAALEQAQLPSTTVRLTDEVNEVVDSLSDLIEETQAQIIVKPLPAIRGIAPLLRQIFHNLLSNAIKYRHPDRPPVISVSAEAPSDDGRVLVTVSDNGKGIAPESLNKIFTPFVRLDSPGRIPGAGIGLATVRRIAAIHNCSPIVDSKLNQGTQFSFRFEYEDQPAPSMAQESMSGATTTGMSVSAISSSSEQSPAQYQVLYIDDDDDEFMLFEHSLRRSKLPITLSFANTREQALELVKSQEFAAVISDYNLAETTGEKLLSEVKEHSPTSCCILTSSIAPLELANMLQQRQVDVFYPKTIKAQQLWSELQPSEESAA